MIARILPFRLFPRASVAMALLVLGIGVSGCAQMGDSMTGAFADPAKYDLYDCKQLETERKSLSTRAAEVQGLIDKANTGTAGPVVAELAYRNDYIAIRGQTRLADEAWQRNRCQNSPPAAAAPVPPVFAPANTAGVRPQKRS